MPSIAHNHLDRRHYWRNRQQELSNPQHRNILTASRDIGEGSQRRYCSQTKGETIKNSVDDTTPNRWGDQHISPIDLHSRRFECRILVSYSARSTKQTDRPIRFPFPKRSILGLLLIVHLQPAPKGVHSTPVSPPFKHASQAPWPRPGAEQLPGAIIIAANKKPHACAQGLTESRQLLSTCLPYRRRRVRRRLELPFSLPGSPPPALRWSASATRSSPRSAVRCAPLWSDRARLP